MLSPVSVLRVKSGAGVPSSITSILPVAFVGDANGAPYKRIPADRGLRGGVGRGVLGASLTRGLRCRPAARARADSPRRAGRAGLVAPLGPPPRDGSPPLRIRHVRPARRAVALAVRT